MGQAQTSDMFVRTIDAIDQRPEGVKENLERSIANVEILK